MRDVETDKHQRRADPHHREGDRRARPALAALVKTDAHRDKADKDQQIEAMKDVAGKDVAHESRAGLKNARR